jgi:hypothetical protein
MAESGAHRIRDIIRTHNQLALTYHQMMMVIQNQGSIFCFEQQAHQHENVNRPRVVVQILKTMYILYECLFSYRIHADRAYIYRSFVKYFLDGHIRRQYRKLHELYLSELVVQRQ